MKVSPIEQWDVVFGGYRTVGWLAECSHCGTKIRHDYSGVFSNPAVYRNAKADADKHKCPINKGSKRK